MLRHITAVTVPDVGVAGVAAEVLQQRRRWEDWASYVRQQVISESQLCSSQGQGMADRLRDESVCRSLNVLQRECGVKIDSTGDSASTAESGLAGRPEVTLLLRCRYRLRGVRLR